ncbi:4-coumarate-CoA ligase 2 [Corynespora cassiicola Philippines]|uniref:4-coumarate-CoA ligase 2 n=1 Tax=Corynespora cassiicola Philippines TaxID=1448308 RepID=A0A2T2NLD8_CORCC|nr:4-coumarate-CoA ligase 2 [Corynespora cassiicola Philippines]
MPITSSYPSILIPAADMWDFFIENNDREYPTDHVLYVDIKNKRESTLIDIKKAAERFGKGLLQHWDWHKGDVLALMTPNTPEVAAVTFGTLYAGGVVCPLNNLYTVDEAVSQLRLSKAKAFVTHRACLEVARKAAAMAGLPDDHILLVDDEDLKRGFLHFSSITSDAAGFNKVETDPNTDLAFLVYSSGTTGSPKGVMLTHKNMVANTIQYSSADPGSIEWKRDRVLGFLPMYHIYGLAVLILSPLYKGVSTFIMERFDLETFCGVIERERITVAYIVPPVALALAKHPLIDKYNLRSLQMLHSSAAPTSKEIIQAIYDRLGAPVKQGYGLSEASPGVASQKLEDWNKPIGCSGRLIPNMSMKITHEGKEVQGHGKEGELWIKGPNIFKGYYENPKATAESIDSEGWYRTGDIGYIDDQENIYITDRVKELIKYNGFQVAPAQLEGLLIGHPAVADVAVIGIYSDQLATELPRAYIVVANGYERNESLKKELQKWLHERVAPHKRLRGGVRFVDAIPKSNAGKLLRRVLMEQAKMETSQESIKARL